MDFDDVKKTHVLNGLVFVLKRRKKKQGIRVGAHPDIKIQGRALLPRRRIGPKKITLPLTPYSRSSIAFSATLRELLFLPNVFMTIV